MKNFLIPLLCLPLLTSCGGSVVDTQTLAGTLSGTWLQSPGVTGAVNLTMHPNGTISGQWQKLASATFDSVDSAKSSFNGLHVKMHLIEYGLFEGNLTKVGNHVSGILYRKSFDLNVPYDVSLDLSP